MSVHSSHHKIWKSSGISSGITPDTTRFPFLKKEIWSPSFFFSETFSNQRWTFSALSSLFSHYCLIISIWLYSIIFFTIGLLPSVQTFWLPPYSSCPWHRHTSLTDNSIHCLHVLTYLAFFNLRLPTFHHSTENCAHQNNPWQIKCQGPFQYLHSLTSNSSGHWQSALFSWAILFPWLLQHCGFLFFFLSQDVLS